MVAPAPLEGYSQDEFEEGYPSDHGSVEWTNSQGDIPLDNTKEIIEVGSVSPSPSFGNHKASVTSPQKKEQWDMGSNRAIPIVSKRSPYWSPVQEAHYNHLRTSWLGVVQEQRKTIERLRKDLTAAYQVEVYRKSVGI
ncbi:hypothetical protein FBU30_009263 [Linnemannia zychae]|nr:hypothetical protein FBU30_009263 [Linnemannia zychae]